MLISPSEKVNMLISLPLSTFEETVSLRYVLLLQHTGFWLLKRAHIVSDLPSTVATAVGPVKDAPFNPTSEGGRADRRARHPHEPVSKAIQDVCPNADR